MSDTTRPLRIPTNGLELSALWLQPETPRALLVLAHGAPDPGSARCLVAHL